MLHPSELPSYSLHDSKEEMKEHAAPKEQVTPPKRTAIHPTWIDYQATYENGKPSLLQEGIPENLIESGLTHGALPKLETEGDTILLLLRAFDEEADRRAASARDLTNKLAIFILHDRIVTAHRFPTEKLPPSAGTANGALPFALLEWAAHSYADALGRSSDLFDEFEASIFGAPGAKPFKLKEAYLLRRRISIIRKMAALTLETIDEAARIPSFGKFPLKSMRRRYALTISSCDSLLEQTNHLLQLHIAFLSQKTNEASQRTNEVMRILTVFSAFFLPLTFIAGVYGMNFHHMPELSHRHGYPVTLGLMGVISIVIWIWFRRRGWIEK